MGTDGPRPPKKYIKSTVTVHDRTQIETVFDYYLFRGPDRKVPVETLHYKVDAFLFYPRQFGLDPSTYPKERFFSDIRPLLRFREPKLGFKAMMGQKPGVQSPLVYLKEYVAARGRGEATEPVDAAVDEARLLACSLVGSLLRGVDRARKRMARLTGTAPSAAAATGPDAAGESPGGGIGIWADDVPDDLGVPPEPTLMAAAEVAPVAASPASPDIAAERDKIYTRMVRVLDHADQLLSEVRGLIRTATALPDLAGLAPLVDELRLVDEYCHYRLRDAVAYLILMAGSDTSAAALAFLERVKALLASEDAHAVSAAYVRIRPDSPEDEKERYIHRRGELKRRIWAVLFLELRRDPLFAVRRQFGAMVAAGFAAIWYAFAQILLFVQASQPRRLGDFWGISGLLFLSAATFAYVVKDRIKEFGRTYFGGGIFRKIPDHSEVIRYAGRGDVEAAVGQLQERALYVDAKALPPAIARLRESLARTSSCDLEATPQVLHYTKDMRLSGKLRILGRYPLQAVHDIVRLNIDAGLPRLGEPTRFLNVVTPAGSVEAVEFPKVYYLDLALGYSRPNPAGHTDEQAFDYFRLVVDKNGLLRIERLV